MSRVPLIDANARPDLKEVINKIAGAREGRLINVYKVLLNSPEVASAWVAFNSAIRLGSGLPKRYIEMAIIRVAIINRTEYVFRAHVPGFAREAGLTEADIDGLWSWQQYAKFDDKDRALLAYVDAVTRDVDVPDDVYQAAARHFDARGMVELTVLIGAYNMHTRVQRALGTDLEPGWDLSAAKWRG